MKIKILSIMLLIIFIFSIGCTNTEQPFLSYQDKNFEAKATLDIKGKKYTAQISKQSQDKYTITFIEPENLKNVCIERNGEELSYSIGSIHIPIQEKTNLTARCLRLFNLQKDQLQSTKTDLYNGVKVNIADFNTDYGKVTLYLSTEKDIPLRIEATIDGTPVCLNLSEFNIIESAD
jgi:hypothetical protein